MQLLCVACCVQGLCLSTHVALTFTHHAVQAQARNVSPVKSVPEKHASSSSVGQAGREAREPYLQAPETSPGRTTPDDAVQENSGMRPSAPTPPEDPELAEALTTREKLLRQVITMVRMPQADMLSPGVA